MVLSLCLNEGQMVTGHRGTCGILGKNRSSQGQGKNSGFLTCSCAFRILPCVDVYRPGCMGS